MRAVPAAVLSLVLVAALAPAVNAAGRLEVQTTTGVVRGVNTPETREWRGIPYAAPPVGDLRWRPPVAVEAWNGVRDATDFADRCLQPIAEFEVIGSEDCLYLNVFAPRSAGRSAGLPVMVHLHAGNNVGYRPHTNAAAFVARDVVVVTLGYRLGVFGFAGHPYLSAEAGSPSGEYALLDQIAALEWVRDNIAAFGGDASNVTLFGESAGSLDATALVASPLAVGLFQRAALQTQYHWALHGLAPISEAETLGLELAAAVGCSVAAEAGECLRAASGESLALAIGFREFVPWVGGAVLPQSPLELIAAQEATVPLLIGSNRDEAAHWLDESFSGEPYPATAWREHLDALVGASAAAGLRELYGADDHGSHLAAAVAAFSDAIHTCPARRLATAARGPVYRYVYAHTLEGSELLSRLGPGHFLDEALLWQDARLLHAFGVPFYEFTEADEGLSGQMTAYWTNFAATGDPNGRRLPEWPAYDSAAEELLLLGGTTRAVDGWRSEECDVLDGLELTVDPPQFHRRHVPSTVLDYWLEGF
jgi:para-nitrobenzyl esterase